MYIYISSKYDSFYVGHEQRYGDINTNIISMDLSRVPYIV